MPRAHPRHLPTSSARRRDLSVGACGRRPQPLALPALTQRRSGWAWQNPEVSTAARSTPTGTRMKVKVRGRRRTVWGMHSGRVIATGWQQSSRRRRVLLELVLLAVLYLGYSMGRAWVASEPAAAVERGRQLLHWEQLMGLDFEPVLNQAVTAVVPVAVLSCLIYATLHYVLTPAALMWMFRRRPLEYGRARSSLVLATAAGLIVFALAPVAPPRLLPGGDFIDTMAHYASYGWWSDAGSAVRGMQGLTNEYAALPSLHMGWAVWVALVVWRATTSRRLRALAVAYPLLISAVVIVTGNHYLVDVAAGAVLMLASDALVTLASQALQRRRAAVAAAALTQPGPAVGQAAAVSHPVPAVTGSLALDDARRPQHQLASLLVAEPSDVRQAFLPAQRR